MDDALVVLIATAAPSKFMPTVWRALGSDVAQADPRLAALEVLL